MATGYTSCVQDGTITDIRDFAVYCAQAFVRQSYESVNSPLRLRNLSDTSFYVNQICEAETQLLYLESLSLEQAEEQAQQEYIKLLRVYKKDTYSKLEYIKRYTDMLEQVNAWQPPTMEHVAFKTFMQTQLQSSIEFDCLGYAFTEPKLRSGEQWLQDSIDAAKRTLEYCTREIDKMKSSVESDNSWITALVDSLGFEVAPAE